MMNNAIQKLERVAIVGGWLLAITPFSAFAQSGLDEIIDQVRQQVIQQGGPDRLGAGYAAMMNFATAPDISAATYYVDSASADDPTINVYKIPLRHEFTLEGRDWKPFVQASFGYLDYEVKFNYLPQESIKADLKSYGGLLGLGVDIPLDHSLAFVTALDVGIVHLESSADYRGPISEAILKPALQGVVFDWDADASLVGVTAGLNYEQQFETWSMEGQTRLTYNHLDTYDSSSDLIDFDANVTTFTLQIDAIKPINAKIGGYPLALVGHFGNATFLGSNRDALGFDYFFEAGLALETDISQNNWPVKKLRLGAMGIFGADVTGWSVIFGYRF
ncbi:MAG: Solitary outer membrane autotransporter beta-barrel domain [Candidatus Competibacteraceae bacterium]|nr:Solitary outer membrane autotransporter beta-barrel domain [Candidatus Competibacteraceae bacterium]